MKLNPGSYSQTNNVPPEIERAAKELIAWHINTNADVSNVTMTDLVYEDGQQLGSFEISVRKL